MTTQANQDRDLTGSVLTLSPDCEPSLARSGHECETVVGLPLRSG